METKIVQGPSYSLRFLTKGSKLVQPVSFRVSFLCGHRGKKREIRLS